MMFKGDKYGFTLVELIIVIVILAILGTIGFISIIGYGKDSRNSARITDVKSTELALEVYALKKGKYPIPDNNVVIKGNGGVSLWNQGEFGDSFFKEVEIFSNIPKDPKTGENMGYSTTLDFKEYELKYNLELANNHNKIITQSYASDDNTKPYIKGDYNGLFLIGSDGGFYPVPSLFIDYNDGDISNNGSGSSVNLDNLDEVNFELNNLVINHNFGVLLNGLGQPITIFNFNDFLLDFFLALQDQYIDNPDMADLIESNPDVFDNIKNIDPTDPDQLDDALDVLDNIVDNVDEPKTDEGCKEGFHESGGICVSDILSVNCIESGKPAGNTEYIIENVEISWNGESWTDPTNCLWECSNGYSGESCEIAPIWDVTEEWTQCSETCGGGTQEKIVNCISSGISVSEEFCLAIDSKPYISQECNIQECSIVGECGSASRDYNYDELSFGDDSFCSNGTLDGSNPIFPEIGNNVSWTCLGEYGGENSEICIANRLYNSIDGVCGTASREFTFDELDFGTESFCDNGIITGGITPTFPEIGNTITWTCEGIGGGNTSPQCEAIRLNEPIVGECGTANLKTYLFSETDFGTDIFCSVGVLNPENPIFPDYGETVTWSCDGLYSGTGASCSADRELLPVPDAPVETAAINIGENELTWNWILDNEVDYYEFRLSSSDEWQSTASFGIPNNVTENSLYCSNPHSGREVRACNEYGCSEITELSEVKTLDCPSPTPQASTNITDDSITWNWLNDVIGITHYELRLSESSPWNNLGGATSVNVGSYVCGATYTSQVRSCSPGGCGLPVDLPTTSTLDCTYVNGSSCSDQAMLNTCSSVCMGYIDTSDPNQVYACENPTDVYWDVMYYDFTCTFPGLGSLPLESDTPQCQ